MNALVMADDDIPPLEDMTVLVDQLKIKHKSKDDNTACIKKLDASTVSGPSQPEVKKNSQGSAFGGMQKGFLFATKPKKSKVKSEKPPEKKQEVDFVVKPKTDTKDELVFNEVQQAMKEEIKSPKTMLGKENWVTDELVNDVHGNKLIMEKMNQPKFKEAIEWFKKDAKSAFEHYKYDKEVGEFFKEYIKIMGKHFTDFNKTKEQVGGNLFDKSISQSDEDAMRKILSNPKVQEALKRPDIQKLLELVRTRSNEAQRLVHSLDSKGKAAVQTLIDAGMLKFEV